MLNVKNTGRLNLVQASGPVQGYLFIALTTHEVSGPPLKESRFKYSYLQTVVITETKKKILHLTRDKPHFYSTNVGTYNTEKN
jgi:hypothetical protein